MNQNTKHLFIEITKEAYSAPLSLLLPKLLTLSKRLEFQDLENWTRLELEGYLSLNPSLTDDTIVPEYRTVAGTRSDEWARPLVITDPKLHFINEDRLRQGVAELERFASLENDITVRDISRADIIKEVLKVDVTRFSFHPTAVEGVLSSIRSRMIDWLYKTENVYPELEINEDLSLDLKRGGRNKSRGLRVFGVTLLVISIVAFIIIGIDLLLVDIFPPNMINPFVIGITAFTMAIGLLLQIKKVYELINKIIP